MHGDREKHSYGGETARTKKSRIINKGVCKDTNKLPGYVVEYYGEGELESNLKKIAYS